MSVECRVSSVDEACSDRSSSGLLFWGVALFLQGMFVAIFVSP